MSKSRPVRAWLRALVGAASAAMLLALLPMYAAHVSAQTPDPSVSLTTDSADAGSPSVDQMRAPAPAPQPKVQQAPKKPAGPVVVQQAAKKPSVQAARGGRHLGPHRPLHRYAARRVAPVRRVAAARPVSRVPAVSPRLPRAGTGGLLDSSASSGPSGWVAAAVALAAVGLGGVGAFAYRRLHEVGE